MEQRQEIVADWTQDAACREVDADLFLSGKFIDTIRAKRVCRACPVREDCLDFALENEIDGGVWGGKTEKARRVILRLRGDQ